jgi:hypothetical protein
VDAADIYLSYRDVNPSLVDKSDAYFNYVCPQPFPFPAREHSSPSSDVLSHLQRRAQVSPEVDAADIYLGYRDAPKANAAPVDAADIYLSYRDASKPATVNSVPVDKADVYLSYRDVQPSLVDATDIYLVYND